MGQHSLPPAPGQVGPQVGLTHQAHQVLPQRPGVLLGEDQASIAHHVGDLAAIGANDGHTAGHRLDQDPPELLDPVGPGAGGDHKCIQFPVEDRHAQGGNLPLEGDPVGQLQTAGEQFQPVQFRPAPHNRQPPHAWQPDHRLQQQIYPLLRHQPSHVPDEKATGGVSLAGTRDKDVGIHAELRDDGQWAGIALLAPDLCRPRAACDTVVGMAQIIAFNEAEGK